MRSRIIVVVILLSLGSLVGGLESSSLEQRSGTSKRENNDSSLLASSKSISITKSPKSPVPPKVQSVRNTSLISTGNQIIVPKGNVKRRPGELKNAAKVAVKTNKLELIHDLKLGSKIELDNRGKRKKYKKRRNQAIMALLLAYKLKFAALVPAIIGGFIMLVSTTALAGFFFALFAAVLGLKGH